MNKIYSINFQKITEPKGNKSFRSKKWLVTWARTVDMPIGITDEDDPKFLPITQVNVKRTLALRTFWVLLYIVTCLFIIVGNGRVLEFW